MTDDMKTAYVMAQVAILNTTTAGMVAENDYRMARGETVAYTEDAFQDLLAHSPCHHNAVIGLFQDLP